MRPQNHFRPTFGDHIIRQFITYCAHYKICIMSNQRTAQCALRKSKTRIIEKHTQNTLKCWPVAIVVAK